MPVCHAPARPTHELPGVAASRRCQPSAGHRRDERVDARARMPEPSRAAPGDARGDLRRARGRGAIAILDGVAHQCARVRPLALPPDVEFTLAAPGRLPFPAIVCLPVGGQAVIGGGDPFTPPWAE